MTIPLVIVAAYSVGAHLDHRDSIVGAVIGIALTSVAIAAAGSGGSDYGFGLMLVVAPWIGGVMVRVRHAAESEAVAGAELRARQAVEEERQRIARELHDIVSHGLSAMVVQAAAAAELVDGSPQAARQAMHEIQTVGADAMTEMRHMLGLMRGADLTDRRPQPGLEDVCDLVAAEQAAGRATILTVAGTPRELPRGLTLSVYRIVQESLTNVRKHARGSHCEVTIAYTPVSLEVAVVDDGRQGHERPREPGFGIMGMRERARLYGGTLDAAPEPRGGWAVRARFPLEHDVVAS
jgi:signal transduction histidine kinase